MGCEDSRPTSNADKICYYTLSAFFQGGFNDEMQLRSHDMIEYAFKNSDCLTKQGIEFEDRKLILNDKL